MENAIVLGAGEVAVSLVNEPDPTVQRWWMARIAGAVDIENNRWGGGDS